jgi:preprotein translocase subunit YajC
VSALFLQTQTELLLAQNVPPKASTPGVVQDSAPAPAAGSSSSPSPLGGFLPVLLMLALLVPIMWTSSRKQKKEQQARSALKRGDQVLSNAGIIGELVEMDDRVAKVKIAPGTTVQFAVSTIAPYTEPERAANKDLKEAKAGGDKK